LSDAPSTIPAVASTILRRNIRRRNARRRFKSGGALNCRPFARRPISSGYFVGGDFKIGELRCSQWVQPSGKIEDMMRIKFSAASAVYKRESSYLLLEWVSTEWEVIGRRAQRMIDPQYDQSTRSRANGVFALRSSRCVDSKHHHHHHHSLPGVMSTSQRTLQATWKQRQSANDDDPMNSGRCAWHCGLYRRLTLMSFKRTDSTDDKAALLIPR